MEELFFPIIVSMSALNEEACSRDHPSRTSPELAEEFMNNMQGIEIGELGNSIGIIASPKTFRAIKNSVRVGFELSNVVSKGKRVTEFFPEIAPPAPPPELPSDLTWKELLDNIVKVLQITLPIMGPNTFLHLFTDAALGFGSKEWSISQAGHVFIYCSLGLSLSVALAAKKWEPEETSH